MSSANAPNFVNRMNQARTAGEDAVGQLLVEYRDFLKLLATASIPASHQGRVDASGIVQETLIKATAGFDSFEGVSQAQLAAWLRTILNRTLIDVIRHLGSAKGSDPKRVQSVETLFDRESQVCQNLLADSGTSPSMKVSRNESALILAQAMSQLSEKYRTVLRLRSIEERTWADVAKTMQQTEGAVRMLWTRALVQLKPKIENRIQVE